MTKLNSYTDKGKGYPIVFIHAFPLNQQMWKPQVDFLAHYYRIVTFDLHGFGQAPSVNVQMTTEKYADEIANLTSHLKIQKCIVVGLSLGGYIVFALLRKYPNLFDGIVLADTKAAADSEDAKKNRLAQANDIRVKGMKPFVETMTNSLVGAYSHKHRRPVVLALRSLMEQTSVEGTIKMLETLASRPDSTELLSCISIPTCIVVGDEDTLTPVAEAQSMHEQIQKSELHIIKNAGHLSNMEDADSFNKIIKKFFDQVISNK